MRLRRPSRLANVVRRWAANKHLGCNALLFQFRKLASKYDVFEHAMNHMTRWFPFLKPQPSAFCRLFCFPHAGGTASTFRLWQEFLSPRIEILAVQLPGRGTRTQEVPYRSLEPLVADLAKTIHHLADKPVSFLGNSMGALISFELAHRLRAERNIEPIHLFLAGRHPPHLENIAPVTFELPEKQFIEELRQMDGTPEEILENQELLELILPALRADFEAVERYTFTPRPKLTCPITVMGGLADSGVNEESLARWQEQSSGKFTLRMFAGNHFFMQGQEKLVQQLIAEIALVDPQIKGLEMSCNNQRQSLVRSGE
jgi:surfactin synthase thioesterase subunit